MKHVITTLAALALCTMNAGAQVSKFSLDVPINQMRIYNDTIFVSSAHAIDYLPIGETAFKPEFCFDVVVYDFVLCGNQLLDAGTPDEHYAQQPGQPQRVFCCKRMENTMGYELSKTADFGRIWWTYANPRMLPGRPHFAFNPRNEQEILIYGTDEYTNCVCPFLLHSTDGLQTFELQEFETDEMRSFATISKVAFSALEDGVVLMATSAGMARSVDGGQTWHYTTPGGAYFTDLCFDDLNSNVAYALEECPVPTDSADGYTVSYNLHISTDSGQNWHVVEVINVPHRYDEPSRPLQGLVCSDGNIYCWAGKDVYAITSPINTAHVSAIGNIPSAQQAGRLYSVSGYELSQPKKGELYLQNGQKHVAR